MQKCNCLNDADCDAKDGTCTCRKGFSGRDCSRICPIRTFGDDCKENCKCENGASCNVVTGECDCTSIMGFTGTTCTEGNPKNKEDQHDCII